MKRFLARSVASSAIVVAAMGVASPAFADPAAGIGLQTSVCDNGETYVFSLRSVGSERSQAFSHAPVHDPASNTVLSPVAGSGTVTIDDGDTVDSFEFSYGRLRSERSGHLTTCTSTYDVQMGPVHVHVESVDVILVSGRV